VAHLGDGFFFQYANECDVIGGVIKYTTTFWIKKNMYESHCLNQTYRKSIAILFFFPQVLGD